MGILSALSAWPRLGLSTNSRLRSMISIWLTGISTSVSVSQSIWQYACSTHRLVLTNLTCMYHISSFPFVCSNQYQGTGIQHLEVSKVFLFCWIPVAVEPYISEATCTNSSWLPLILCMVFMDIQATKTQVHHKHNLCSYVIYSSRICTDPSMTLKSSVEMTLSLCQLWHTWPGSEAAYIACVICIQCTAGVLLWQLPRPWPYTSFNGQDQFWDYNGCEYTAVSPVKPK